MSVTLFIVAMMAILTIVRLYAVLDVARSRASQAERLAALRGRSLSLASQELHALAAAMSGCLRQTAHTGEPLRGLCAGGPAGRVPEGPVQQLFRLADDLATVATGPTSLAIQEAPTRLGPIVDSAIAAVGAQIRPSQRHWQVDPGLRALTVQADRIALQGALTALLRRAASHSRQDDVIALRWVVASETVAIIVEDDGDGLAVPETADPVATQTASRGLDLGLSLARSLAVAHGGDVRLEAAPGIGARAWLTLPRKRLLEAA